MGAIAFPRSLDVEWDSREKREVQFPASITLWDAQGYPHEVAVTPIRATLEAGDYRFKAWPTTVGVETKRSWRELENNAFGRDRPRCDRALDKLQKYYDVSFVVLETGAEPRGRHIVDTGRVFDQWARMVGRRGIRLMWMPSGGRSRPTLLGEYMIRLMWAEVYQRHYLRAGHSPEGQE